MRTIILSTIILLASFICCLSQGKHTIKGIVISSENGKPITGVNVVIKNTSIGTFTDLDGNFEIEVDDTTVTLVFSFVGCVTQEIVVNNVNKLIQVSLEEDIAGLDEVVVGSGERKSSFSSYSFAYGIKSKRSKKSGKETALPPPVAEYSTSYDAEIEYMIDPHLKPKEAAYKQPPVGPGILTAGEVNDFSKWELWDDISENDLKEFKEIWQINPLERYTVQLTTHDGYPIIDSEVSLLNKEGKLIWQSRTDNTGKAEFWVNIFDSTKNVDTKYVIEAIVDNQKYTINEATIFHEGVNILEVQSICNSKNAVDIAFVVDATGSMGDEIEYLKAELNDVISKVKDSLQNFEVNLGSVFYRDNGEEYLTRKSDFNSDISSTIDFIKNQSAAGGGDMPEAVETALQVAINELNWGKQATSRLLFLVLDAPPHNNSEVKEKLKKLTAKASEMGIRIIPVTCSGIDKSTEYLMRSIALATNGTYTFLTDHSGVGNPHIEPTTDEYDVEKFNDLLVRIICQFSFTTNCKLEFVTEKELAQDTLHVINPIFKTIETDSLLTIVDTIKTIDIEIEEDTTDSDDNVTDIDDPDDYIRSWKYYPNPTSGIIYIEVEGNNSELFISDISGKVIQRHEVYDNNKIVADITSFPTGIYFIRYEYETEKWLTGKVILMH